MNEPCPTAKTLADYGAGKLTPDERREVEKHVVACEDCFELFAAAAVYRSEKAAERAPIAHAAAKRPRLRWWYAAAAAAMALAVWGVVRQHSTTVGSGGEVLDLVRGLGEGEQLEAAATRAWSDDGGGLGFGSGLPMSKRGFRLGVHLFDARVALEAGDEERLAAAFGRAALLLPSEDDGAEIVERLRRSAADKRGQSGHRADLDRLATAARSLDPQAFDLGAWAEAGRLAALGTRIEYLASTIAERADELTLRGNHEPAQTRTLEAIRTALSDRQVSAKELSELELSFERLILLH
jgi:hypothetical protein